MRWDEFERGCPQIASIARERFAQDELVLVGTLRSDGSPRISPVEPDVAAGRLFLGMMWQSKKALDLLRDPRVVVHSVPITKENPGGDVTLRGIAESVDDPGLRQAYRDEIRRRIDWAPDEPQYHLFSIDVGSAAHTVFGERRHALVWDPVGGLRRLELP